MSMDLCGVIVLKWYDLSKPWDGAFESDCTEGYWRIKKNIWVKKLYEKFWKYVLSDIQKARGCKAFW